MELIIEKEKEGFDLPSETSSITDILNKSFQTAGKMIKKRKVFIAVFFSILSLLLIAVEYALNNYLPDGTANYLSELFSGSASGSDGNAEEMIMSSLFGVKKVSIAYIFYILTSPVSGIAFLYLCFKYLKNSTAVSEMKTRNFISYFFMHIANSFTIVISLTLAAMLPLLIMIIASFLFGSGAAQFIGSHPVYTVLLLLSLTPVFIISFFYMIAVASPIQTLTVFSRIYPIRCLKLCILSVFRKSGNRKGGLFGSNVWKIASLNAAASISFYIGFEIIFWIMFGISKMFPAGNPAAYLSTALSFSFLLFCMMLYTFISFSFNAIYSLENIHLSAYPIRKEIASRYGS